MMKSQIGQDTFLKNCLYKNIIYLVNKPATLQGDPNDRCSCSKQRTAEEEQR